MLVLLQMVHTIVCGRMRAQDGCLKYFFEVFWMTKSKRLSGS